nr:CMRF35-like molecule 7 [Pogona vitticeps]
MQLLSLVALLLLLPGCFSDLTGPGVVHAAPGTSAHVQCRYDQKYEANAKYWCRITSKGDCLFLVRTSGLEYPVKVDRVSIRDNHTLYQFTVTMDRLTASDAGTYRCGVRVNGGPDLLTPITVKVSTGGPNAPDHDLSSNWDSSSIRYLIYVSFLILIGLKTSLLLLLVFAISWMYIRTQQSSAE